MLLTDLLNKMNEIKMSLFVFYPTLMLLLQINEVNINEIMGTVLAIYILLRRLAYYFHINQYQYFDLLQCVTQKFVRELPIMYTLINSQCLFFFKCSASVCYFLFNFLTLYSICFTPFVEQDRTSQLLYSLGGFLPWNSNICY